SSHAVAPAQFTETQERRVISKKALFGEYPGCTYRSKITYPTIRPETRRTVPSERTVDDIFIFPIVGCPRKACLVSVFAIAHPIGSYTDRRIDIIELRVQCKIFTYEIVAIIHTLLPSHPSQQVQCTFAQLQGIICLRLNTIRGIRSVAHMRCTDRTSSRVEGG